MSLFPSALSLKQVRQLLLPNPLSVPTAKDFHNARIQEVASFTGDDLQKVAEFADAFTKQKDHSIMRVAWEQANPSNAQERELFYKTTTAYIYNLMFWREILIQDYRDIYKSAFPVIDSPLPFLDFGGGNGDLSILFGRLKKDCHYIDLGKTRQFANWRFQLRELNVKSFESDSRCDVLLGLQTEYSCVICLQLLESLEDPVTVALRLASLVAPGGRLILKYHFGADVNAPFHLHTVNKFHIGREVLRAIRESGFQDQPLSRFDPARVFVRIN